MSDFDDERHGLKVIDVADLTDENRQAMLTLHRSCFANVPESQFNSDLDEKEWVVLGTDHRTGQAWSFTTARRLHAVINGERIMAIFSGDTAARTDTRGAETAAGIRVVIRKMFHEVSKSVDQVDRIYWFMISSTFKSYRLLPMLFQDYAPSPNRSMSSEETHIAAELSRMKGFDFNPHTGIVRLKNPSFPRALSAEAATAAERDPHARFFLKANPGAEKGDRLASLIDLSTSNLTPLGARLIALEEEQVAG